MESVSKTAGMQCTRLCLLTTTAKWDTYLLGGIQHAALSAFWGARALDNTYRQSLLPDARVWERPTLLARETTHG